MNEAEKMLKIWTPDKLFDISNGYWKSCTLHAAVQLGIFSTIEKEEMTIQTVAEKLSVNERALKMLFDALVAMELLIKTGDYYSNNPTSEPLLNEESLEYIGYIAIHHHNVMQPWSNLKDAIISGKSIAAKIPQEPEGQEMWWKACIEGMLSLAIGYATYLATKIDLSNRFNLLDLGGGPGTYAIQFCKNNPQLKATVVDVAGNAQIANRTIERFGAQDQVQFVGADLYTVKFEQIYDVVWISHVIHGENEKDAQRIFEIAVKCLKPGGLIMVHDYFMNDDGFGPLHPALFSLNMLLVTLEGKSYGISETKKILEKAGVTNIQHVRYEGELDSCIIMGNV